MGIWSEKKLASRVLYSAVKSTSSNWFCAFFRNTFAGNNFVLLVWLDNNKFAVYASPIYISWCKNTNRCILEHLNWLQIIIKLLKICLWTALAKDTSDFQWYVKTTCTHLFEMYVVILKCSQKWLILLMVITALKEQWTEPPSYASQQ